MDGVGKGEGQGRSDIQRDTISLITRQQLHQFNSFRWNIQSTLSQSAINFIRCSIPRAFFFLSFLFLSFFFLPFLRSWEFQGSSTNQLKTLPDSWMYNTMSILLFWFFVVLVVAVIFSARWGGGGRGERKRLKFTPLIVDVTGTKITHTQKKGLQGLKDLSLTCD